MFNSFNFINKSQKEFFKNYGYIVLQNQLTYKIKKNLKSYVQEIELDSLKKKPKFIHKFEYDSYNQKKLCRTEDLIKHSKINKILTTGSITDIVSQMFDKEAVLYKEKINYKYPNTGLYRAHQDITAYPNSKNHITALINLCPTNKDNGAIEFSPLCLNNYNNNEVLNHNDGVIIQEDLKWTVPINTNFGDIILFDSYIPHRSYINKSINPRTALYVTYNSIDEGYLRDEYYNMKKKTLKNNKISLIDHYDGNIITNNTEHRDYVINYIINLYETRGHTMYDKHITQLEHAFQTMNIAIEKNYNKKFQLACFLHDIGHLLLDEHNNNGDFLEENLHHETIGFNFLAEFFDHSITYPILSHVTAKKYLCTKDKNYYDNLSEASKKSFEIQGGYMTTKQMEMFEKTQYFNSTIKLRQIEDESKNKKINVNKINYNLHYVKNLISKYIKI